MESEFIEKVFDLFFTFSLNDILHEVIYQFLQNMLEYLFKNIDKQSSEFHLNSFLDHLFKNYYEKIVKKKEEVFCLGYFDKLCFFIHENYLKI